MHLKAKPPIFVPAEYRDEIESMSKACLMDLVWDIASACAYDEGDLSTMETIRRHANVVTHYRANR